MKLFLIIKRTSVFLFFLTMIASAAILAPFSGLFGSPEEGFFIRIFLWIIIGSSIYKYLRKKEPNIEIRKNISYLRLLWISISVYVSTIIFFLLISYGYQTIATVINGDTVIYYNEDYSFSRLSDEFYENEPVLLLFLASYFLGPILIVFTRFRQNRILKLATKKNLSPFKKISSNTDSINTKELKTLTTKLKGLKTPIVRDLMSDDVSVSAKLSQLKKLYVKGLITEDEYTTYKKKFLDML